MIDMFLPVSMYKCGMAHVENEGMMTLKMTTEMTLDFIWVSWPEEIWMERLMNVQERDEPLQPKTTDEQNQEDKLFSS